MASTVLQTARIFEDPEPPKLAKSHKRTPSVGDVLRGRRKEKSPSKAAAPLRNNHASPSPLGERHINSPPQPKKIPLKAESTSRPPMHKKTGSTTSLKGFLMGRDKSDDGNSAINKSDMNQKKMKSSTNLAGLLKKRSKKDLKENEPPSVLPSPSPSMFSGPASPPLWSPFDVQPPSASSGGFLDNYGSSRTLAEEINLYTPRDYSDYRFSEQKSFHSPKPSSTEFGAPQRPFLEHKSSRSSIFTENLEDEKDISVPLRSRSRERPQSRPASPPTSPRKSQVKEPSSPEKPEIKNRSSKIFDTIATLNMRPWRSEAPAQTHDDANKGSLSPQELDSAMESMLGKYDVPENLRDQLRNLKPEVKAGLMKGARIGSGSSVEIEDVRSSARRTEKERPSSKDSDDKEQKQSRSRSRPRSRILSLTKRGDASPSKQDSSGRSRSKSRPKSIDMTRPSSFAAMSSTASLGSLASPDSATTPGDFIHYLKEVQKPELVEIGKIHKLRILLRNESVTWTDTFVKKGGMDEIVNLIYRIMKVEWREEHEDNLLHQALSCLKGLATTQLAMQRLETLSQELFPALVGMLFDPERKGPAEYTTRGVIISLLFSYLSATRHSDIDTHAHRACEVLSFLRDPEPKSDKQVVDFVSQMHTSRPYRIWCKEVNNVTKEVFWIFLHHLNVVPVLDRVDEGETEYRHAYFPSARAPHPAAPYVGGVEWEATQYVANHLDLLNAIIVALPTSVERNALRDDLRLSGFEKIMGGSLRTCKEKFYAGVHDGLRAWVAAARRDDWYVEDVRAGPPRETASPKKSPVKKKTNDAPQLGLDVGVPMVSTSDEAWL